MQRPPLMKWFGESMCVPTSHHVLFFSEPDLLGVLVGLCPGVDEDLALEEAAEEPEGVLVNELRAVHEAAAAQKRR